MDEAELRELIEQARARYEALTPEQKIEHDYEQKRSFVRGMCPDSRDYAE